MPNLCTLRPHPVLRDLSCDTSVSVVSLCMVMHVLLSRERTKPGELLGGHRREKAENGKNERTAGGGVKLGS